MKIFRRDEQAFIRINFLFLSFVAGAILLAYSQRIPIQILFWPPPTPFPLSRWLFTHTFQILCSVPPLVCAFTFFLLNTIAPNHKKNSFFFVSAVMMGLFWLNEIYRIHIIFLSFGLAKIITIMVYGVGFIFYILLFWRQFKTTNYWIFALGIIFLSVAILIDTLHLKNSQLASILEGIPKLLSGVNLVLYFWDTCRKELLNIFMLR
ncbi:hypothetical protein C7H19_02920 [Aphanothece hegewaldii CCALA 016]|uniref:Uncharacterized protein n=1 Tax=Aphanothece hegewaldii CCALA 016 TaxID=2107694 RepID=A0A2T1M2P9_9CHRO|nr:hypothetical protein [Aphanothece hegewaldii]PSF39021.1 hypothetical protein C7H19_02920 [Aphanothece hegewaldii CCALA 016]